MRRKAFDSTLLKRAVCVEPPHTWDANPIQGRMSLLYIVGIWEGEKCCQRRYRTPNFEEADLAKEEIWNLRLTSLDKNRQRIFSVEEDSCMLSKNRGWISGRWCRVDR